MKQNWLKNNISELIAISFMLFAFIMFRLILLKEINATDSITISIIECIKGVLFLIIGYYFGSSIGSKMKQQQLDKNKEDEK